jgi:hypothetical protein
MVSPVEHALLGGWDNFYVIVGSSAAALTGLQFVVITLIGDNPQLRGNGAEINAFGTPTVVHFCAVLVGSAIMSAPWHDLSSVAMALGVCSALGVAYTLNVIRRASLKMKYQPVLEDWIFHAGLPLTAYASALVAALLLAHHSRDSLFVIAADSLLLLLVGIHNAWDTVIYVAIDRTNGEK